MAQNKLYRILSVAVMATVLTALLAVTAFADITGGFGVILGLEDGKTYTAKTVTINSTGDGIAYVDADEDGEDDVIDLATENENLAGLYEVTEGDNSVLVYVYGDLAERAKLGNWTTDSTGDVKPVFEAPATTFKPGTWMAAKGSVWANDNGWAQPAATATSYLLGSTWVQSADLGFELFALTNSYETAKTKLTAANLENVTKWYNTYYNWDDVVVDVATGEPIEGKPAEGVETTTVRTYGDIKDTGIARANAIRETTKTNYESFSYKYAYEPGEIVPVDELKEFPYYVKTVQWYTFPSKAKAQAIFYVVDKNGEVSEYTWTSDYMSITNSSGVILNTVIDMQSILPDEGWVVGVEIKPFGVSDASSVKAVTTGSTNSTIHASQYQYLFHWDKYMTLFGAPEGVTLEGRKFIGLQADEKYVFAPVNVNGIVRDESLAVPVTGVTEFAVPADAYGLWGLFYDREGNFELGCIPVYTYGKYNDRKALGSLGEGTTPLYKNDSSSAWFPGYFNRVGAWDVESFRINDIFTMPYSAGKFNEALATEDTSDEEVIRRAVRDTMRKVSVGYAYTTDEIVPIGDVKTMKFGAWSQNIYIAANNAKPMIELYIIDTEGFLQVVKTVIDETWSFTPVGQNYSANCIRTLDVQSIEDLPEGWLVAYKYYPIYDVALEDIVPNTTASQTSTSFGTYMRTPSAYAAHSSFYVIDKPAYATPNVTLDGTVISGLDASKTYTVAPYNANGMDAGTDNANVETVTGKTEIDLAALYEGQTVVGLYGINVNEDDIYAASAPAIVYVKGAYADRENIHEFSSTTGKLLLYNSESYTDRYTRMFAPGMFAHNSWTGEPTATRFATDTIFSAAFLNKIIAAGDDLTAKEAAVSDYHNTLESYRFSYGFTPAEIVPVSDVKSYSYTIYGNTVYSFFSLNISNITMQFDAYIMDENGNINVFTFYDKDKDYAIGHSETSVVDFKSENWFDVTNNTTGALPKNGYLVGYAAYPFRDIEAENLEFTFAAGKNSLTHSSGNNDKARCQFYFTEYKISVPAYDTPEGLVTVGSVVSGLDSTKNYVVVPYGINGAELGENNANVKKVTAGVTDVDLATLYTSPAGLYRVHVLGDKYFVDSAPVIVYIAGDSLDNILHTHTQIPTAGNYKDKELQVLDIERADGFVEGNWTEKYICNLVNYSYDRLMLSCGNIVGQPKTTEAAIKNFKSIVYQYQYYADEVIPLKDFSQFKYQVYVRQGSLRCTAGTLYSTFTFVVVTEDGTIERRTVNKKVDDVKSGYKSSVLYVSADDFADKSGYIVGIEIAPFGAFSEDVVIEQGGTTDVDPCIYLFDDSYSTLYNVEDHIVEKYDYNQGNELRYTNKFNIINYNAAFKYQYAYSDDNENAPTEGWTDLTDGYVQATELGKYVWVKRLAYGAISELAVCSDKPSEYVVVTGVNLVLDGTIGVKVSYEFDPEVVDGTISIAFTPVGVDADAVTYYKSQGFEYHRDNEKGTGYAIMYVLPKHAEKLSFQTEFIYNASSVGNRNMASVGHTLKIPEFVETYTTDAQYAAVKPLIEALETYYTYTANYFDTEAEALADLALSTEEQTYVSEAVRNKTGELAGISHHSTSLVLESSTTLRHYFKLEGVLSDYTVTVNDVAAEFKTAEVTGENTYVYVDVENIAAHELDKAQVVKVTKSGDTENAITVNCSAVGYVGLAQNDTDAKLANLAKAVAKYAYEANEYIK